LKTRLVGGLFSALVCCAVLTGCGGSTTTTTATTAHQITRTVTVPVAVPEMDSPVAGVQVIASTLQLDLQRLGYEPGPVTGDFSPATLRALRQFQAKKDTAASERGALGPDTTEALKAGSDGTTDIVSALQSALTDVGLFHAPINGSYDQATIAAVRALQTSAGIPVDGFYGPQTAAALEARYAHNVPEPPMTDVEASTTASATTTTTLPTRDDTNQLLKAGSEGPRVKHLQKRLTELGYRPGPMDGTFGAATASAVLAFQKREGLERDGVAGMAVEKALVHPEAAGPRPGPAPRIDIDIARQLVFVVSNDGSVTTLNSSTGNGETYSVPGGGTDVAYTPVGSFTVLRKIPGDEHAPLGTLHNPMYFYRGWAIHGAANVPAYPASHGCARISNADADWLFPQIAVGTPVIVYDTTGKSPGVDNAPAGAAPGY
jgi:peptidoglycan hydrolase-like protein with peptidoglycan-binding domain